MGGGDLERGSERDVKRIRKNYINNKMFTHRDRDRERTDSSQRIHSNQFPLLTFLAPQSYLSSLPGPLSLSFHSLIFVAYFPCEILPDTVKI